MQGWLWTRGGSCGRAVVERQEEPEGKADRKQKRVRTAEKAGKDTRAAPGPPERCPRQDQM